MRADIKFCMLDTNFYTCAIKNRIVLRVSSRLQDIVEYDEGDDLKRIFYKALNWDNPVGAVIRRVK